MIVTPTTEVIEQKAQQRDKQVVTQSSDGEENIVDDNEATHIFTESIVLESKIIEDDRDLASTTESN